MSWNAQDSLYHHGILGQKWGVRRYQNYDGTLTAAGRERYSKALQRELKREKPNIAKVVHTYGSPAFLKKVEDLRKDYHTKVSEAQNKYIDKKIEDKIQDIMKKNLGSMDANEVLDYATDEIYARYPWYEEMQSKYISELLQIENETDKELREAIKNDLGEYDNKSAGRHNVSLSEYVDRSISSELRRK